ncbi:maleylpyruvate isomerase family mycothiol-dependent enzyme [Nocardioides sp.]|uniref:maleylpyruvate isomerase family mycothiol-dependent enzyme n=1 Tax=Nocardioides sp. TaxID=35761 RepID=UPI002615920F|nr:maleylpyruvate isomerase family mycothiol-dependent enzyme [Nocardioides sp.]
MSSDTEVLSTYVDTWRSSAAEVSALLRDLDAAEWDLPTALPGWDVRAVAAHLAHLESELAGIPQPEVVVAPAPHITGPMSEFTERGPIARRGWAPSQIVDELDHAVALRSAALTADPPQDPDALAPGFAGLIGWTWRTLLSNRPLDLWMHEQDIRRATGRPGGLTSAGARHTAAVVAASLPFVVGKRAQAPIGSTVALEVTGALPATYAVTVGEDGRARPTEAVAEPTARITLDFGDWIALAGGRVAGDAVPAVVQGDADLAERALRSMAVTP